MTTDNNKAAAAAQTLFRFASLRNPQLAEAKNNDNFIVRNTVTTGYFDALIQEWYTPPAKGLSKLDYLSQRINENSEISTIKKSEKDIKSILGYFYDASKILSQKSLWDEASDLDLLINKLSAKINESDNSAESKLLNPTSVETKTLWDSLIYQMLTQKDFYVKEIIIQALQMINYYNKHDDLISLEPEERLLRHQKVASAKVVLPDYLFIDSAIPQDENTVFTVNETKIGGSYIYEMNELNKTASPKLANPELSDINYANKLEKMELSIASYKRNQLELLKKELKKQQKNYQKSYEKDYNTAYKQYQAKVNPLFQEYKDDVSKAKAAITPEMTEAQKEQILSNFELPNMPEFNFEKQPERNLQLFAQKLSQDSLNTLVNLFAKEEVSDLQNKLSSGEYQEQNVLILAERSVVFPDDEHLTFNELFETIDENLTEVYNELNAKANVEKEQFVKLGGALVPVNKSQENPFAYSFMAESTPAWGKNRWDFYLTLNLPDASWNIQSLSYQIQTNNEVTGNGVYYTFTRNQGEIFISGLFENSFLISNMDFPVHFEIEIIFTNGESTKIMLDRQIVSDLLYPGIFKLASDEEDEDSQNNVFVPNGFGIKRLGVADYMKVDQSTHAYVEGEVANIENIMAREYRDKSTRRLRRSEITETSSKETEREKLTDTTTVNRYEMQTEVSNLLQQDREIQSNVRWSKETTLGTFEVGGGFANHTSKETATRQAVSKSQDITARALDRIVSKVKQERVEKVIEEFEENNSHGFDNRKGDKHVVGVYRWVDKLMKNQIYNYGKRMMLEFMIPQPAKLHELAVGKIPNTTTYDKPIDPRTDAIHPMKDGATATEEVIRYWADYYKVELTTLPAATLTFDKNYGGQMDSFDYTKFVDESIQVPDNYAIKSAHFSTQYWREDGDHERILHFSDLKGNLYKTQSWEQPTNRSGDFIGLDITKPFQFQIFGFNIDAYSFTIYFSCELSDEFKLSWRQEQISKIFAAYDEALKEWQEKMDAIKEDTEEEKAKEKNAQYYRQIEEVLLKHNCIAYLLQSYVKLGTSLYKGKEMKNFKILLGKDLNDYTALAKFMEQAFEWEIMDYTFYPYYWGNKEDWKTMFLSESIDPLFRSFLQAGMGRVIVTVKPGFEDAVNFYLATGKIWNGGEVPVIGDPLYLSITDELREPQGEKYGKSWITRIPTSLTILQAESIGLQVQHALPFTQEDPKEFENPKDLITESNFEKMPEVFLQAADNKAISNIEINNDYLQLTTNDNPHQVVAQLPMDDLKEALEK